MADVLRKYFPIIQEREEVLEKYYEETFGTARRIFVMVKEFES